MPLAAVGLLFAFLYMYGALRADIGMLMTLAGAALLTAVLLIPGLRISLAQAPLGRPTATFVALLAVLWVSLLRPLPGPRPGWTPDRWATLDPSATQVEIVLLLGMACYFLVGVAASGTERRFKSVVDATVAVGALYAAWSVFMFLSGLEAPEREGRLDAHLLSPNSAATLFGVIVVLGLGVAMRSLRRSAGGLFAMWQVAPALAASAVSALALLLTDSRMGLTATVLAALILFLLIRPDRRLQRRGVVALVILGMAALAVLATGVGSGLQRMLTVGSSEGGRLAILAVHWPAFLAAPLQGYGLGTFDTVNQQLLTAETYNRLWNVRAAHNVYLQWLEEAGVLGALAMAAVIGAILITIGAGRRASRRSRTLLAALIGADVLILTHGLSDFALQTPAVAALWALLLGLQFGHAANLLAKRSGRTGDARINVVSASVLAGGTASLGALVLFALTLGGEVRVADMPLIRLAAGYDRRAERLAQRAEYSEEALERSRALSAASAELRPFNARAHLRLAALDVLENGSLTPRGEAHFAASYDVAPLEPSVAVWRISYALEHWGELSPETRAKVDYERRTVGANGAQRASLREALGRIANPRGRLIAAFWILDLRTRPGVTGREYRW